MCGVSGFAANYHNFPVDQTMIYRMTDILQHRGPDSRGFYIKPGIGLGFRRLSIIDLETGNQPISNEDDTITVVCNGEIYNYKELRKLLSSRGHRFSTKSDVEVIVHLYEDYGEECLKYLRGMFGLALWDARKHQLMLARDRVGIKPLHYALRNDGIYFASELKSILASGKIEKKVDDCSLRDIFSFGFVSSPKTLFANINRLLPGHYLIFKDGKCNMHSYWEPTFAQSHENSKLSVDDWAQLLFEKLKESVNIHLRSDVEVGAWLSAGIDSSSIVSLMSHLLNKPIQTFTLGFENSQVDEISRQRVLSDFPDYKLVQNRIIFKDEDLDLFTKALWHSEDPFTSGVEVCSMLLAKSSSKRVKVVLTGEGADEILGGYSWYKTDKILRPLSSLPLALRKLISYTPFVRRRWPGASRIVLLSPQMNLSRYRHFICPPGGKEFLDDLLSSDFKERTKYEENAEYNLSHLQPAGDLDPFTKLQYHDMKIRLPDCIVHHLDRASMAYSVEARVPFLDHELIEFCAKIPASVKMKGLKEKFILRLAMKKHLPHEIAKRPKHALSAPFNQWFRGSLPGFAKELLSDGTLSKKGYFDPNFVNCMLKKHRAGKGNFGRILLGVLGVQLWDDLFMQGSLSNQNESSMDLSQINNAL